MGILRTRGGIPRFARKVMVGEPVTIVAFGSSLTLHSLCDVRLGGRYLEPLPEALYEATKNARVRLVNVGLEGFTSWWAAHRVRGDVLPHAPDLMLIEFAHNDSENFVQAIPQAIDGIVAQVREKYPACDFAFVLFAPPGEAAAGPTEAMIAYEKAADFYGFPSFDLATLAERVVSTGAATWAGAAATALTFDGFHHTERVTRLLGEPFADAMVHLVRASLPMPEKPPVYPASLPASFRSRRSPLRPFLNEQWTLGPAVDELHCKRDTAAYIDEIAFANAPGASAKFVFAGLWAQVWVLSIGGTMRIVVDGLERTVPIPKRGFAQWSLANLASNVPEGVHNVEFAALEVPCVLGDLFVLGELVEG